MTTVLDLHPIPGHPAAVVAGVHEVLDGLDVGVGPGAEGYAAVVAECARARARLEALELRLVAAASRERVPQASGARDAGAWLAGARRDDQAASARDARLAAELDGGLVATQEALATGEVTTSHARVIAEAVGRLPDSLGADQRAAVEQRLVADARQVHPTALRRRARRALGIIEADQQAVDADEDRILREQEARARQRTRLTLHDNGDGTTTGHFTVPTMAASVLRTVVESMTSPRRGRLGATAAQAGVQRVDRDWAHERGLAFAQVLEHLPTEGLAHKVAATVVVKLDLDTLVGQVRAAGLDTGEAISAGEARRLACGAGILPAVLGGGSLPLDLGRSRRLFSSAQRVAAALRHDRCAADGCEVPYAWCELHHRDPWSRGGKTDLADLVPVCGFHHHRIHDPGYRHRHRHDGSVRIHRRT